MPQFGAETAPNQTNIITAGDPVGDPLADPEEKRLAAEANSLPGQTYVIQPTDHTMQHDVRSMTKELDELIAKREW